MIRVYFCFSQPVPKQLISLLKNFIYIFCRRYLIIKKKPILNENIPTKIHDSWKRFICLK